LVKRKCKKTKFYGAISKKGERDNNATWNHQLGTIGYNLVERGGI
jgi:hypothetical protein